MPIRLAVAVALVIAAIAPAAFAGPELVPYKHVGDRDLVLHVFKPAGWAKGDARPGIVLFHGGGWSKGDPSAFYPQARRLAELGMVAISAQYRLTAQPGVKTVDCISDAKSAMRYVRANAADLGINPDKIAAGGGSAGGHLAAALATVTAFDDPGDDTAVSCVPQALALYNPVVDLSNARPGYGFGKDNLAASPLAHVHAGLPPTILFHGTADTTVPFEQAKRFAHAMTDAGNVCELVPYEGRAHGFFNENKSAADFADTTNRLIAFLRAQGFIR